MTKPPSFWQRFWSAEPNPTLTRFDVLFGIIFPIGCLVFDPIVFRDLGPCSPAVLGRYQILAYVAVGIGEVTLVLWWLLGQWLAHLHGLIVGICLAGAVFASGVGLFLLPETVIGLMVIIGILGFVPFLTALVYGRLAYRLWVGAWAGQTPRYRLWLVASALVSFTLALGVPALLNQPHALAYEQRRAEYARQCADY